MSNDRYKMIPDYTVESRVQILAEVQDYNHKMMNIPEMWKTTRGENVKLVVLDTGVPNHVDLSPIGGRSFIAGYQEDLNGHATHVAGIIAALANNNMGVAGIAPDVEDYYGAVLGEDGSGTVDAIVDGIHWAVDEIGADVINMSLGIPANAGKIHALEGACEYAVSHGVTVIAAAGNESGDVGQPAQYDSVIAVAAVDKRKKQGYFSNTGPEVDFAAGGVNVYSTYLNNGYAKLSGTSMASPALAAVAALIIAKHRADGETLTPKQVREHILKISYDVGPSGFDEIYGHGIPIFGHNSAEKPVEEEPIPEPPEEDRPKKMGPLPDCSYWKLWNTFISETSRKLDKTGSLEQAISAGITAVSTKTAAINSLIKKKK